MYRGWLPGVGIGFSVITPAVVIRPIWFRTGSVNHSAPSGPAVISPGELAGLGMGNSVICPLVVILPILPFCSVNHSAPSGPAIIPPGWLLAVGIGNSVKVGMLPRIQGRVNRIILPAQHSVAHMLPSGPVAILRGFPENTQPLKLAKFDPHCAMPLGALIAHGNLSGPKMSSRRSPWQRSITLPSGEVTTPVVVIRYRLGPMLDQIAPSGAAAIPKGSLTAWLPVPRLNSFTTPLVVIRPIFRPR